MDQPRPSLSVQLEEGEWHSFPSGDVLTTMALVVGGLCLARRPRRWYWLLVLPVLVGAGRLIAAKHFPSDVVGGLALGAVAGLLAAAWACQRTPRPEVTLPAVPVLPELEA
jgi:undecaprenyl-diphosphatase